LSFEPGAPWRASALVRECNADIYHSQEPSFATYLARRAMPDRKHIVTLRDTHELADWLTELRYPSLNRLQVLANKLYEDNPMVQHAVRKADRVYCAAEFLRSKAVRKYHLPATPELLPTPVAVPESVTKSERPTVCYLARWDRRKRPELFLRLAESFPEVRFVAFGSSRDPDYERHLKGRYAHLSNLEMPGYVDQFRSPMVEQTLAESWILVNTSSREGLPNAFIEACAHGCAILSAADPDGFASRFGIRVKDDDFATGLTDLLRAGHWRSCGERGRRYIRDKYELHAAIGKHLAVYHELVAV
jgi:glycosyltransferase involved in cell wall biosynthesis